MADIRINALATTAASTASDDFVAVDGSANGTRKLNAFSPTFGGNLTVSGTDVKINNAAGYFYVDSGSSLTGMLLSRTNNILELSTANNVRLTISAAGNTTLSGNLTVSGGTITGGTSGMSLASGGTNQSVTLTPNGTGATIAASSGADSVPALGAAGGRFRISTSGFGMLMGSDSTGAGWIQQQRVDGTATSYPLWLQPNGGNVLVGTTTDVAAYKLNVYGATSANVIAANGVTPDGTKTGGTFGTALGGTGGATGSYALAGDIAGRFVMNAYGNNFIYEAASMQAEITTGGNTDRNLHVAALDFYTKPTASNSLTRKMRLTGSGNLLIGTTTDGGQKLQVSGTGYLSDSLRVGTSWSPLAWGVKAIEVNDAGGGLFAAYYNGTAKGYIIANSGDFAINTQGANSLLLRTNGTTALTLDSSQNATFAGAITSSRPYQDISSGLSNIYVYSTDTAAQDKGGTIQLGGAYTGTTTTTFGGVRGSKESTTAGETGGQLEFFTRANGGAMTRRAYISSTGNATFTGSIAIGNTVNTVSPTSPNRTITMVIGGTTYYIHAKTTND